MRKLQRPPKPDWFDSFASSGEDELFALIKGSSEEISHSYLRKVRLFDPSAMDRVKAPFLKASEDTCHVCESPVDHESAVVNHFRPMQYAGNERKDRSHPQHYWWLTYEWANFQLLCPYCNRYKGSLFPVEGDRLPIMAPPGVEGAERRLLLNPYDDDLSYQFSVKPNGELVALSSRFQVMIDVYHLNRDELLAVRGKLYNRLVAKLADGGFPPVASTAEKNALIDTELRELGPVYSGIAAAILGDIIRVQRAGSTLEKESIAGIRRRSLRKAAKVSVEPTVAPDKFEARWIRSVEIRDFGPLRDLTVTFPAPHEDKEPWLGVVGENGVGKSSFLKAVTLCLASPTEAARLAPDAARWHNRGSRRKTGHVKVKLSDGRKREMYFTKRSEQFRFAGEDVNIPVIALGAHRITDRKGSAADLPTAGAIDNLFDPILPLEDAEAWLADTGKVSSRNFRTLADNLKFLMDLPLETKVSRLRGEIFFERQSGRLSLSEMSDGYRSVIGLAAHLMKHLAPDTPVMSEAEGTVLLDELELHLHPVWKIRIVEKLRELFPRVRFVISTHDPLCLRGLREHETFVFRRDEETDQVKVDALVLRPGMDVDDLLTGGWFGLGTTFDSDTENLIHDVSLLSLKADRLRVLQDAALDDEEAQQLAQKREILSDRITGFSGSDKELRTLADVARRAVREEQVVELDPAELKNKLLQAFGNRGGGL